MSEVKTTELKDEDVMQDQDARDIRADLSQLSKTVADQHIETIKELAKLESKNEINALKIGTFVTGLTFIVASVVSIGVAKFFGS